MYKREFYRYQFSIALLVCASLLPEIGFAHGFQAFAPLSFRNPTDLLLTVKNNQFIIADALAEPNATFTGVITVPDVLAPAKFRHNVITTGSSSLNGGYYVGYGRLATRFEKNLVVSIDVTQPFVESILYPNTSPVRYASTSSIIRSYDFSPNFAYQLTKVNLPDLSIGAGLDFLYLASTFEQKFPSLPKKVPPPKLVIPFGARPDLKFSLHSTGYATGWHVGILYHIFKHTHIGFTFFSSMTAKTSGISRFTGFADNPNYSARFHLPSTMNVEVKQSIGDKWKINGRIYHIQWDRLHVVLLKNTAIPTHRIITAPTFYTNTWRVDVDTHYQFHPKVNLGLELAYDQFPTVELARSIRSIALNTVSVGVNALYKVSKTATLGFVYAHFFTMKDTPINFQAPGLVTRSVGKVKAGADVFGIEFRLDN